MKKVLNLLFSFLKYILLLVAFGVTLFLVLKLYARLEKNIKDSFSIFIPYILLFILFLINICLDRQYIKKNLFFNVTCCLVCATNIMVAYRAMFDTNMIFYSIQKMGVNFNYFNDYLSFNNIMLYGLSVANMIFMLVPNSYSNGIEVVDNDTADLKDSRSILKINRKLKKDKENESVVENIKISEDGNTSFVDDINDANLDVKISSDSIINIDNSITNNVEDNNNTVEKEVVIKKIDIDDEII